MNTKKLIITNLESNVTKKEIELLFSSYGDVNSVKLIKNKGYGYVEMSTVSEARIVKKELNGSNLWGRSIKIDEDV